MDTSARIDGDPVGIRTGCLQNKPTVLPLHVLECVRCFKVHYNAETDVIQRGSLSC